MREFLGLDTSNYTTSCAIFDAENGTVRQAKKLLPVKAGMQDCGRVMLFSTIPDNCRK